MTIWEWYQEISSHLVQGPTDRKGCQGFINARYNYLLSTVESSIIIGYVYNYTARKLLTIHAMNCEHLTIQCNWLSFRQNCQFNTHDLLSMYIFSEDDFNHVWYSSESILMWCQSAREIGGGGGGGGWQWWWDGGGWQGWGGGGGVPFWWSMHKTEECRVLRFQVGNRFIQ